MATYKMLRLNSLPRPALLTPRRWSSSTTPPRKASEPLRILFCGSDEFSAASLRALNAERARNPALIQSIDVVVRPPKPTGRGYKVLREVPLQSVAASLSLPLHTLDTFTGWTPPASAAAYNLIVAVSFGLFVPRRLLRSAAYGGLNVHPSLLPDLRGPAPLHRALLLGRSHTGVSLQTLSEDGFDRGEVLAQTPPPGLPIPPDADVPALRDALAAAGAEMLVDALRAGLHAPPRRDVGCPLPPAEERAAGAGAHAPKITKRDAEVRWDAWSPQTMARRARVLGDLLLLWSRAAARDGKTKRVIFRGVEAVPPSERLPADAARYLAAGKEERKEMRDEGLVRLVAWRRSDEMRDGGEEDEGPRPQWAVIPYFAEDASAEGVVVVPLAGGDCVRIREVKLEGEQWGPATAGFRRISHTAEEFQKLEDDSKLDGGGGTETKSYGADALTLGVMGLLESLL